MNSNIHSFPNDDDFGLFFAFDMPQTESSGTQKVWGDLHVGGEENLFNVYSQGASSLRQNDRSQRLYECLCAYIAYPGEVSVASRADVSPYNAVPSGEVFQQVAFGKWADALPSVQLRRKGPFYPVIVDSIEKGIAHCTVQVGAAELHLPFPASILEQMDIRVGDGFHWSPSRDGAVSEENISVEQQDNNAPVLPEDWLDNIREP